MRKQTQSTRQQLMERQSAQYVNDSELPFSAPPTPPRVVKTSSTVSNNSWPIDHPGREAKSN